MFDFVRKHTRLLQFLLVLIIFPSFVLVGVQGYSRFNEGNQTAVAHVDGQPITQAQWDAAHRIQVERTRAQMQGVDPAMFDTPQVKRESLDALVRERVVMTAANAARLSTPDDRLQRLFRTDPQLAFLRNPDGSLNKDALIGQGMTAGQFEGQLRAELTARQVFAGVTSTAFAPTQDATQALDAYFQQREIQVQRFLAADYADKAAPTPAELEAYYNDPAHAADFQAPEQAQVEYVMLDLDSIAKTVTVSEDELRKYYTENQARYAAPEERRASHILIKAEKSASDADKARARAKADALLAQVRKDPSQFAELAKKNSDDPGSAAKGGDLDYFPRGAMVKPFEDAAYTMKPGDISDVVQSDFGFHIIRLTDVRGGTTKPFEAVRGEIDALARKQAAQKRYAEAAEQFSNLVYEQSDSLKPVVDRLKLELQTGTVLRKPEPGATGPLTNAKLIAAVFGNDALANKRNTEAVETAPNTLVSARVKQYTPARKRTLAESQDMVRAAVVKLQSRELARKAGQALLAAGKSNAESAVLGAPIVVSRAQPKDQPPELLDAVLQASAATLPGWLGVDLPNEGYAVVRVNKVLGRDPVAADPQRAQRQYAQAWGNAEQQAYYNALKTRFKVEVKVPAAASAALP